MYFLIILLVWKQKDDALEKLKKDLPDSVPKEETSEKDGGEIKGEAELDLSAGADTLNLSVFAKPQQVHVDRDTITSLRSSLHLG